MMNDEPTVVLGALLRGLVKYLRDSESGASDQHTAAVGFITTHRDRFAKCVDVDLLLMLVQDGEAHSQSPEGAQVQPADEEHRQSLRRLVERATRLAASEPITTSHVSGQSGLTPIFDQIELKHSRQPSPRYFHQQALAGTNSEPPIFAIPEDAMTSSSTAHYAQTLSKQLDQVLERLNWDDFECVYTHLINFLQTYTWCIPSSTNGVSLYDESRLASAIAACLYQHHDDLSVNDQSRFVLVIGGLSGIQDYIFGISTIGAGGVAKRLRARSFFVQMMSDVASLRLLRRFKLPLANILMASGSKFYILLPNLPNTVSELNSLQGEFDARALEDFHGEIAVNLAWTDLPESDFAPGRFSPALARLHSALEERKARRLAGALQDESGWKREFAREPFTGDSVCLACHRFPATRLSQDRDPADGPDICDQCDRQAKLGRRLTSAQFISFFGGDAGETSCLGMSFSLAQRPQAGAFLSVRWNDPDLSAAYHLPTVFRYMANYIPRDAEGAPLPFDKIAGAEGLLGILKADVDNLGLIFQEGFQREAPASGLDTLSRFATLSRQLDWFFTGWLEWLVSNKYADCYTVYSGGDDLLIVGPRARTLDLAREIRKGFIRYTQNMEVTLSAGLAVVKHRLPLAHTVHQANIALTKAKDAGRDRLCMLGDTVLWDNLASLFGEITDLAKCRAQSSFLYHLLHYAELWQQYRKNELQGLRYHSLLAYDIGRNVSQRDQPDLHAWSRRLLQFPPHGNVEQILNHLNLITQWVLLEKRGQDGEHRRDLGTTKV